MLGIRLHKAWTSSLNCIFKPNTLDFPPSIATDIQEVHSQLCSPSSKPSDLDFWECYRCSIDKQANKSLLPVTSLRLSHRRRDATIIVVHFIMPSRSQSRSTSESTPLLRELSPTPLPSQSTLDVIRERDEVICEGDGTEADDGDDGKGLEGKQIFFLCLARTVEPIAFFGIFPFINQMIFEMGVRKEDVGFWSGLVVSFSVPLWVFDSS